MTFFALAHLVCALLVLLSSAIFRMFMCLGKDCGMPDYPANFLYPMLHHTALIHFILCLVSYAGLEPGAE